MAANQAGYSGTPLAKKLGIKPDHTVAVLSEPEEFRSWLELPPGRPIPQVDRQEPRHRDRLQHQTIGAGQTD